MPRSDRPTRWTAARWRALLRSRGPGSLRFRRRVAVITGAIAVGVLATLFALVADAAGARFEAYARGWHWAPLATTPLGFVVLVWLTRRFVPLARGSGIPQVIAASEDPAAAGDGLIAVSTVTGKAALTWGALLCGASVGREGPTVQLAAAIMGVSHRLLRVPLRSSVIVAGGAAGVAAAFNTPLAGILFAIEELAAAYEQRVTMLVLSSIAIAGMVAQSLQGDYVYFGAVGGSISLSGALLVVPVAGVVAGGAGGLFSRAVLTMATGDHRVTRWVRAYPLSFAGLCGLVVAGIGVASGLSWGTGYAAARAMMTGVDAPWWFGPAKFATTLATAVAGLPGGIFAPSLAVGAGVGNLLAWLYPGEPASAVVILGMTAYFAGVVRAPLTAVVILSEATASRGLLLPMFATAFIADGASRAVCREKLYHGLAQGFMPRASRPAYPAATGE